MTNPTSNFGWQMPTSTDLVTDLPADFEVFGQAVDTSLADLKGGTTGQVLAKASNTNMDFTWVAQDDSNAIQNAIVDAKGDLIAASAADTPARLAVGNNGETLVADSSTSTGLRYNPQNALVNPIINGGFDIAQRGTSVAVGAASVYTLDRWKAFRGGLVTGMTVSRQATGDTTNLPNIQYCARVQRDSGNTSTQDLAFETGIETINSIPFVGKTVTVSFYARKGANYSQVSSVLPVTLYSGTGTDQVPDQYTGIANIGSINAAVTTTFQRFAFTATVGTSATEIGVFAGYVPVGTAGAADYYEITGVQIDLGTYTSTTAPTFRRSGGTIQGELSACQRYYYRNQSSAAGDNAGSGYVATTDVNFRGLTVFPVTMRTSPTALEQNGTAADYGFIVPGALITCNAVPTFNTASRNTATVNHGFTSTGVSQGTGGFLRYPNANGYLGWSAEL